MVPSLSLHLTNFCLIGESILDQLISKGTSTLPQEHPLIHFTFGFALILLSFLPSTFHHLTFCLFIYVFYYLSSSHKHFNTALWGQGLCFVPWRSLVSRTVLSTYWVFRKYLLNERTTGRVEFSVQHYHLFVVWHSACHFSESKGPHFKKCR